MYSDPQTGMGLRARAVNGLHAPPSVSNVELCLQMFDMGFLFLRPNKVYIHTCIVFIKLLNSLVWCLSNVLIGLSAGVAVTSVAPVFLVQNIVNAKKRVREWAGAMYFRCICVTTIIPLCYSLQKKKKQVSSSEKQGKCAKLPVLLSKQYCNDQCGSVRKVLLVRRQWPRFARPPGLEDWTPGRKHII